MIFNILYIYLHIQSYTLEYQNMRTKTEKAVKLFQSGCLKEALADAIFWDSKDSRDFSKSIDCNRKALYIQYTENSVNIVARQVAKLPQSSKLVKIFTFLTLNKEP